MLYILILAGQLPISIWLIPRVSIVIRLVVRVSLVGLFSRAVASRLCSFRKVVRNLA